MRYKNGQSLVVVLLSIAALSLSACESSEDDNIAAAQACLDQATTASQANQCSAMVQGDGSAAAYLIRCSADFISQGFTATLIASAFQGFKNAGSTDPTVSLLSYLIFNPDSPDVNSANQAVSDCQNSEVASMVRMAIAAQLATTIAAAGGSACASNACDPNSPNFNPAAIQTAAASFSGSPATVGTIALTAQASYCAAGSEFTSQQICTDLNSAVTQGGGNASTIGTALLALLQSNTSN